MKSIKTETLHHYTNIEGFEGIIKSHSFRMTQTVDKVPANAGIFYL